MSGAVAMRCDVTEHDDVDAAAQTVLDHHARLGILANNAGQTLNAPIGDIDVDDFRATLDPNLVAPCGSP